MTALSGSETIEQAYGLARLLRVGLGAHGAVLPELIPDGLGAFRAPLAVKAALAPRTASARASFATSSCP